MPLLNTEFSFANKRWQPVGVAAIVFVVVLITPLLSGFPFDLTLFQHWANHNRIYGLRNAYASGSDYLPFYQYILWAFGKLAGSAETIKKHFSYLRIVTLCFDILGLALIYRWAKPNIGFAVLVALALANIGYSYNTLIWAQIDAIWTVFGFGAYYLAWQGHVRWSVLLMALCFCTKLQGIVLLPLWGVLVLYSLAELSLKASLIEFVKLVAIGAATIAALFSPFILLGSGLEAIQGIITESFQRFPRITLSADNIWILIVKDAASRSDTEFAFGAITYKVLGLLMFFSIAAVVLLPLLIQTFKADEVNGKGPRRLDKQLIWLTGAIICLSFFYFNTEMHERYVHPAGIFLTAYAFHTRRCGAYLVISLAYFLNLEVLMKWFQFPSYKVVVFQPWFVASLYTIVLVWLLVLLLLRYRQLRSDYFKESNPTV